MEGIVKDGECLSYAKQKWTAFGAAWKRRPDNRKIPHEVSESVYYVRFLSLSPYFAFVGHAESSY